MAAEELPELTSPDKVLYPEGYTKRDVFEYYRRIAPWLLPHLRDRPVTLERLPEGLTDPAAPRFFQKNIPASYPDWVARANLPTEQGKAVHYALVNDLRTLLYLVNQNTLSFHVWFARAADPERPDLVLFDLDPGEMTFADAVAVAKGLRALLSKDGIDVVLKTSGKTGLHLLTRWQGEGGHDAARDWAMGYAERVVKAMPDVATVERSKARRGKRLYVDVMQNARAHHAVPAYVLRAIPGAPVSTPLDWRELTPDLDPKAFNLRSIFRRLARKKHDPLAGLLAPAQ
jgi:bifunctional non-homologous end joining protein LigD